MTALRFIIISGIVELIFSEVKLIVLKKRNMIYFGNTYNMDFKKLPEVIVKLDEVLEINENIVEQERNLQKMINNNKYFKFQVLFEIKQKTQ